MHHPEDFLPFLGQLRLPRRCHDPGEEARDPFLVPLPASRGLFPLALLKILLELRRLAVPLLQDRGRHLGPEPARLVRQLVLLGRHDLARREERRDVDQQLRLLRPGQRVVYPLLPRAADPGEDIAIRHVADLGPVVVVRVVAEDDPFDSVLGPTKPSFLQVLQDDLDARLGADHVARIHHGDGEGAPQQTADVGVRVRELVLLVAPVPQGHEDAQVVLAGTDADARTRELGADLVEAPGRDASFRTVDVEGGHRRVVGGLLGQEGDPDPATTVFAVADPCSGAIRCAASGGGGGGEYNRGCSVFGLPVTLRRRKENQEDQPLKSPTGVLSEPDAPPTLKNSPRVEL